MDSFLFLLLANALFMTLAGVFADKLPESVWQRAMALQDRWWEWLDDLFTGKNRPRPRRKEKGRILTSVTQQPRRWRTSYAEDGSIIKITLLSENWGRKTAC